MGQTWDMEPVTLILVAVLSRLARLAATVAGTLFLVGIPALIVLVLWRPTNSVVALSIGGRVAEALGILVAAGFAARFFLRAAALSKSWEGEVRKRLAVLSGTLVLAGIGLSTAGNVLGA